MTAAPLRIDFVSDVTCPWCAIGQAGLERALGHLGDEVEADLRFEPFELNPDIGRDGEPIVAYAMRKHGAGAAELARRQALIRQRGAEAGLALAERTHVYNTFDAHRLIHWAGIEGRQRDLKRALLIAYHVRRENPALPEVLARAATDAALDAGRALEVLDSGEFTDEVRAKMQRWRRLGIDGVPAIIVDGHWLIQGAQPAGLLEESLRRISADRASRG